MNKNDFRYIRRGKHLADLREEDLLLMHPINQLGKKNDQALLLLHGFSSSPAVYRYLIPQLKNYDAIICPALPGHGQTLDSFSQIKADEWLSFAVEACEALFAKYKKVDVLGLSLGGLLACKLSERFSFHHIYLLAPALILKMNVEAYLRLVSLLQRLGFKELRGAAGNIMSDAHAEISFKRIPLTTVVEMFHLVLKHQWQEPKVPVDLFLGVHDAVVDSRAVEKLFANLPNVHIHWLENSAHVLPLDNDLQQIVDCINQKH